MTTPVATFGATISAHQSISNSDIIAKGEIATEKKYYLPINIYMKFVLQKLNRMIGSLEDLKKNLKRGNIKKAQTSYVRAHSYYESIRPIMALFVNIEAIVNGHASYFLEREKDHRFTGFHAIEYQLFELRDINGASKETDQLLLIVKDLKNRVLIEKVHINQLIQASIDFIDMIIETKLAGKENIYSLSDLTDIAANLKGSSQIIEVLKDFIKVDTLRKVQHGYSRANKILLIYKRKEGLYESYNQFSKRDKMALYSVLMEQAELLSSLRAQLNIDTYYNY